MHFIESNAELVPLMLNNMTIDTNKRVDLSTNGSSPPQLFFSVTSCLHSESCKILRL